MKRYVDFIFKYKKALIIGFIMINIAAIIGIIQVRLNTDFSLFTTNDSEYETTLEELVDTFGSTDQIMVLVEMDDFGDTSKSQLRNIQGMIEGMSNVDYVQGPAPMDVATPTGEIPFDLITPEQLLTQYTLMEEFSPIVIQDDTYYGLITVFVSDDFGGSDVSYLEEELASFDLPTYIAGDDYNQVKIVDYILQILFILPPLAILVILLVFRWQIGALLPTILSVVPAAIGSIWTFGIIGYMGNEVSILTAVVPIFIIVIGSADGLHFMTHFQESRKQGLNHKEAMTSALKVTGIPMIVTTLTSMAGFLSLLSMDTSSIVDLAVFASLGILLAGVATWYVLPLILSNNFNVLPKKQARIHIPFADYIKKLWGIPSVVIVLILLTLGIVFSSSINHEFDMLSVYKKQTVVAQNATKLEEVNGGSIPLYIIYKSDNIVSIESMNEVEALITALDETSNVNRVINPYRLLQIMFEQQVGGDIPNDFMLNFVYDLMKSSSDVPIDDMFDAENNVLRLMVFPSDMTNDTLIELENLVNDQDMDVSITGTQYLLKDLNVSIGTMQRNSIVLALAVVFVMLLISLRDVMVAFISIIPISITVASIYAVLGMTGIPLNITTVIIFSISIGVGIDYAVHFSSVYKMHRKENNDKTTSVQLAYQGVSKPVIANALGISLGLSVMLLSPLTIHTNVSILMWVGMIISVLMTLTFLPTIFSYSKK
ncbi:efflux RND transporter permease subunit [Candidatus Xianfuyuplasma coldseepsis]|uniref:RND family transporter n=1 Tax=Candidatus Xianfuyuplasma coldseepsis TaxID=2782163 RepID=A0A7L7KS46_9MOLU|nr:MMPL family transporter [Xianfuyuplasma coldseepsis]QMS85082.1 RND family transporter [Xianfuyuplasma coldseepsis]